MRRDALIVIAFAVPALSFVAYVVGYFVLSQESTAYKFENTVRVRFFATESLARLYAPAVRVEAYLTGWEVSAQQFAETTPTVDAQP
jgi:hypothetical protein